MAKSKSLKVYLDHHIKRENLLYQRSGTPGQFSDIPLASGSAAASDVTKNDPFLKLHDLQGRYSKAKKLRKPDFQRATWAWSPEECVDLLEAVLEERVVPSVIMWLSPDNFQYVLDGGHRISVLLAWIKDDWGDKLAADDYRDPVIEENNKAAASLVRQMMRERGIGLFQEYEDAEEEFFRLEEEGKNPRTDLQSHVLRFAEKQRRWSARSVGFPILWVEGDYEVAEDSFLKINKTGRRLSEWETKLVENRSSSFARAVMSVSQISTTEHFWTVDDPEVKSNPTLQKQIQSVLEKVHVLHDLLFQPPYRKPISDVRQPLLATPYTKPEMKPAYLAELLTIAQGKKGQKPETEALIKKDKNAKVPLIIANGDRLLTETIEVISNIYGNSSRSMGLLPLLYYYNDQGIYVRSLLYGMIYWLNHGTDSQITDRKFVFTLHRKAFETVLRSEKEKIIQRIGRKIGSGPEVTYPTARYFHGLLQLLVDYDDQIDTEEFKKAQSLLIRNLGKVDPKDDIEVAEEVSPSRTFRGGMSDALNIGQYLDTAPECEICGGKYYPGQFTQIDHKKEVRVGGETKLSNARNTHPFCNNRRKEIEAIRAGEKSISLPPFNGVDPAGNIEQLSFLKAFEDYEDTMAAELLADEEDDEPDEK